MYRALLDAGALGEYVQVRAADVPLLEPAERTLAVLMDAGFDDETAARSLTTLAGIATSAARDRLMVERDGVHPRLPQLRRALQEIAGPDFGHLARLAEADIVAFDERQLAASISLVLDGMEARLSRSRPRGRSASESERRAVDP